MFEQLDGAIDALLDTDLDHLDDDALHELTVGLQRTQHRLEAAATRVAGTWDARRCWADDGSKSAAARLACDCGMAEGSTRRVLHRARRLRTMPVTSQAFAAGDLSSDVVDLLARANTTRTRDQFADAEAMLVGHAGRLRYADLARTVTYWRQCADDAGTGRDAAAQYERRHGSAARTSDGMVHGRLWLDPIEGTVVLNELERLERQLYLQDLADARARLGREPGRDELARDAGQRGRARLRPLGRRLRRRS